MKNTLRLLTLFVAITLSLQPFQAMAKRYDATLSFIMYTSGLHTEEKRIVSELSRNFTIVQPFDLTKRTNFYLHYYLTDENYIQYEVNTGNLEDVTGEHKGSPLSQGHVGSRRYESYKRQQKLNTQFSSGANDYKASIVVKPYKGTMVLYNSYGTELLRAESTDHYKTESAALKNTIRQMRRAIDRNNDKMSIKQKFRCLFCDYDDLKNRQKEKIARIAYITHRSLFEQLYGDIANHELPDGLMPYANLYSSLKDYDTLEHIIDASDITFEYQPGTKRLPGHLINEIIRADAPDELIDKVANEYRANNFQELDKNNLTPLWSAISQKDTRLMEKLIALGANVNQVTNVNGSYLTPLILSAQYGDSKTTELLLSKGARKDLTTASGLTAWTSAMWLGKYDHAELVWPDLLIDANSLEAQNLLTQAAYYGMPNKVNELIGNGVPVTARGVNGDNIVIAAIKGIKTFSIEPDFELPGATLHRTGTKTFWDIIDQSETAGLSNPMKVSVDSLRQTVLFHAYPDGSNEVKDEHINLITGIIRMGIDPQISNVNGQTADQVYQDARLAYLDGLYESQLSEINQERKEAAQKAKEKQEAAQKEALEILENQDRFQEDSRARSRAKRQQAIAQTEDRINRNRIGGSYAEVGSEFADDDDRVDTQKITNEVVEKIREAYANDIRIANEVAAQKIDDLEDMIYDLKQDEADNAASRQVKITRMLADASSN